MIAFLFSNARTALALGCIASLLMAWVMRDIVAGGWLAAWVAAIFVVNAARYPLIHGLPTDGDADPSTIAWYIAGIFVSGIVWGSAGFLFFSSGTIYHQVFLAFILGGMVAGTVASYAAWMPAFYAFAIPALVPIASRYFLKGDDVSAVMGGLLALYGVALAVLAHNLNRILRRSVKLQSALGESEERFRLIAETSPMAMFISAIEGGEILFCNAAGGDQQHVPHGDLIGRQVTELYKDPADRLPLVKELEENGEFRNRPLEIVTRDGEGRWVNVSGRRIMFEGKPAILSAIVDTTDQRRADQELRESERRYRDVVEGETTLTVRFKPDTTLTFVNTAYAIQRQTPPGKLIGRKFIDFMADEEKDELLAYLNSFTIDRPVNNREIRSNQPDGTIGWRAWTHRAFFDEDGKVAQFQGVGTDITMRKRAEDALREAHQELELRVEERTRALRDEMTERNRAEEKARRTQTALAHAQRVSTVGEMATQLALELNQPLSAVANYAESALLRLRANSQESEELVSILTSISEQAQRAGEIIRRIRGFVRKEEPKVTHVDVPAAIRGAVELFGREAQENGIAVVLMLDDNLPKARADTIQVQQVVLNLMRNGMEAMLESGRAPRRLSVHATATENGEIRVTVSNTGNVLTEEVLKKMFDPFFTTKSSGLGMGLSICRSIIDLHGGRIWATSDDISGTIFHFTLSAAEETRHDAA